MTDQYDPQPLERNAREPGPVPSDTFEHINLTKKARDEINGDNHAK